MFREYSLNVWLVLTCVSGEAFLARFLQGGLVLDPSVQAEAPTFWGYLFGGGGDKQCPAVQALDVPYDLVQVRVTEKILSPILSGRWIRCM
jgi:hypothetical protein